MDLAPQPSSSIAPQPDQVLVTAIIPAHNEAPRIGAVLQTLEPVKLIGRIIVVDDGSTDGTRDVVEKWMGRDPRIRLRSLPENRGKGSAMVEGARLSHSDIVLFLDADLVGLRPDQVEALARPVLAGRADMTVGLFRHGRLATDWSHLVTPFLSGQRCLRWSLFGRVPLLEDSGWGVEAALSLYAEQNDLRIEQVILDGVTQVMKEEKGELSQSLLQRARMYGHIVRYVATFLAGSALGYRAVQEFLAHRNRKRS